jgi:predicted SnoaL-like aldol condensation-catalyzing enzyme
MTIEDNKTVVRRFIDALFTEGDLEATDDYLSDDFVNHDSPLGLPRRGRTAAS